MLCDGWTQFRVDDLKAPIKNAIAIGPFGSRLKTHLYTEVGVPVIRGSNITDGRHLAGEFVFVGEATADELRSSNVFGGDLVFPHRGAIGQVAIVPADRPRYQLSTSLMKLSCDRTVVDPLFLFYYFRSPDGRHELLKNASTVGTPGIGTPLASLRSIRIHLPSLSEQRRIAGILGALDDKIELNRRMNETLEELFSKTVLGGEPGVTTRLGEIAENIRKVVDPGDIEPDTPYIALEHMPRRSIALADWGNAGSVTSAKSCVHVGDVLFGKLRPYFHKVGIAPCDGVCSTDILVIRPSSPDVHPLALAVASSDALVAHATAASTGTKMPRASWRDLADFEFEAPTRERLSELNTMSTSLLERINANINESRTLAALRDALLPKLISGELRIRDAACAAEQPT